jgi:outer membrane receptor for ferrienterochelin and colicins
MPRVEVSGVGESDDSQRRRQNAAMSIYGREELDRQGDIDITDVLKRLPSVSMDGGAPRLRGLGGGYTQVLINGEPAPPGFSLDSLAPGDVERIEVIKGATAEFPGVAGTINIVLREPPRTLQREWRGGLNYRAIQPGGSTSFQWGDRIGGLSFVLPVSTGRSSQGTTYDSERVSRNRLGEVQAQAIHGQDIGRSGSAQLSPRLQWKLDELNTVNLGAFAQRVESRSKNQRSIRSLLGTPWQTVADGSQTQSDSDMRRLNAQWQRKLASGGRAELKASWQSTERETAGVYEGFDESAALLMRRESLTEFEDSRLALGGRLSLELAEDHKLTAGWDIDRRQRHEMRRVWEFGVERLDSATGVPFAADIDRLALFVQDDWSLGDHLSLLPGIRFEQISTRSADASGPIDNQARIATPLIHLKYRLDAKGRDLLRASLTRSFKLPDLSALVARYVVNGNYERDITNTPIAADRAGNPLLRPELSTGLDLAFEHYPASGGVLSIGMFYRLIDDLVRQRISLEAAPAPGVVDVPRWVSRPVNVGRAISLGLEFEIKGRAEEWLPGLFRTDSGVQLRAAWNVYRSRVEQVDGPDNRLEAQPPWLANMGFDWRVARTQWTLGASLVLQPSYTVQQTDRQLSRRSAVRNLDAFASWRLDRTTQLRLGLSNLLAADNRISSSVADLDGFAAGSSTRRNTLRAINASWVARF